MSEPKHALTFAGAGALGQGLAAFLCPSVPVTLFTRTHTAVHLLQAGVMYVNGMNIPIRSGPGTTGCIGVVDAARDIPSDDAVIFTTKAPQLPVIVDQVRADWARTCGFVAGLQNGIGKDGILLSAFGPGAVVGAVTMTAAGRDENGRSALTTVANTYIGELDGSSSERCHKLAEQFRTAGLPTTETSQIVSATWMKACNSAALFGTSALTRLDTTSLLTCPSSLTAFLDLVAEAVTIAAASGFPAADYEGLPPIATYTQPDRVAVIGSVRLRQPSEMSSRLNFSSMAQDVKAGRPTEVDSVLGELARRADALGLSVARLRLARDLILSLDEHQAMKVTS